jgi:hypothetical protein
MNYADILYGALQGLASEQATENGGKLGKFLIDSVEDTESKWDDRALDHAEEFLQGILDGIEANRG